MVQSIKRLKIDFFKLVSERWLVFYMGRPHILDLTSRYRERPSTLNLPIESSQGQTDIKTNSSLEDDAVIHPSRYIKIQRNRTTPQHEALGNKSHKLYGYFPEPLAEVYCFRLNFNISKLVCCKLSLGGIHMGNAQCVCRPPHYKIGFRYKQLCKFKGKVNIKKIELVEHQ